MDETQALLTGLLSEAGNISVVSYRQLFEAAIGQNPHELDLEALVALAGDVVPTEHISFFDDDACRADYLDAVFSHQVEPTLRGLTFVYDYPACQAALARLDESGQVARRFEVFLHNIELANGYDELCDASVLRARIAANNEARRRRSLPEVAADERLLAALDELPACAGIAVGLDRLLMLQTGASRLDEVMAFTTPGA